MDKVPVVPANPPPGPGSRPSGTIGALIDGPIAPTLLRLAAPTIAVLVIQTFVGIAEVYFVGHLGTDALAGVSLVFPVLMLMTMMSNGGIGGGVASAVARALGGGRRHDADALVLHSLLLAIIFGLAFAAGVLGGGTALFSALGGAGATLAAAERYATFVFGGAVLIWSVNLLAASLRGAGEVRIPALVTLAGAVIVVPLSPALIFGLGPLPAFGIAGAGLAVLIYYAFALLALLIYLRRGPGPLRLASGRLEWRLFREILGVGGLSAIGTVQSNLTVAAITGCVGAFGTPALAGYGLASRLDYLLIPLLFGLGTATVTMVGTSIGAGRIARARRIAWTAALMAAAFTEAVGVLAALLPQAWIGLFSSDPAVLAVGASYLRIVAPFYSLVGLGMLLYFASQGAGRVAWPVLAGTMRLIIAAGGAWLAVALHGGLTSLFAVVALSSIAFGGLVAAAVALRSWEPAERLAVTPGPSRASLAAP
jgi:putative MATE family efflux protein